ncbi:hypothetical protein [Pedobacter sp. UYP24]
MTEKEQKIKDQLRNTLPYGSNAEIKRRIKTLKFRTLSSSMIGNVLNPKKDAWDNDVISMALDIATENAKERELISEKATSLQIL